MLDTQVRDLVKKYGLQAILTCLVNYLEELTKETKGSTKNNSNKDYLRELHDNLTVALLDYQERYL